MTMKRVLEALSFPGIPWERCHWGTAVGSRNPGHPKAFQSQLCHVWYSVVMLRQCGCVAPCILAFWLNSNSVLLMWWQCYYIWHVVRHREERSLIFIFYFFVWVCSLRQKTDGFNLAYTDVPTTSPVTDFEPRSGGNQVSTLTDLNSVHFYAIVRASFCLALAVGSKERRLGRKKKERKKSCILPCMTAFKPLSLIQSECLWIDPLYIFSFVPSHSVLTLLRSSICGLCLDFRQCNLCLSNSLNT